MDLDRKMVDSVIVQKLTNQQWEDCLRSPWTFGRMDFSMIWSGDLESPNSLLQYY